MAGDSGAFLVGVFERAAADYDTALPFFARFGRRLVEVAAVAPGERVLDVACGNGASLLPAAQAVGPGGRALGIDAAPAMVATAASRIADAGLGPSVDVRVGDAADLDVEDATVDVALCGFTIMLVADPARVCAELRRVVRPGGRVALSMPTGAGPEWGFQGELMMAYLPRATRPLPPPPGPPPDLHSLLTGVGFGRVDLLDEVEDFVFADADVWWRWVWSQGMRAVLEALPPDALDDLRADAAERLVAMAGPDGIPLHQGVRYALASV